MFSLNSNFLLDYIPSYYKNMVLDSDGYNPLQTIFDTYALLAGDSVIQSHQVSLLYSLENINPLFYEYYVSVNISTNNQFSPHFESIQGQDSEWIYFNIDAKIISFAPLFSDSFYKNRIDETQYYCGKDLVANQKFLAIKRSYYNMIPSKVLFAKHCFKNDERLKKAFGILINFERQINEFDLIDNTKQIARLHYETAMADAIVYKDQIAAIYYVLWTGPTIHNVDIGLCAYLGLPYCEIDGTITELQIESHPFNITVQSESGMIKRYTISNEDWPINPSLKLGYPISRFDLLVESPMIIYDIVSDPARFTQKLLCNNAKLLTLALTLQPDESYGKIRWDTYVTWDPQPTTPLYWDMGHFNVGTCNATNTAPDPGYLDPAEVSLPEQLIKNFNGWTDTRYNDSVPSPILYEGLHNIFFVEFDSWFVPDETKMVEFINRIKPSYTKFLYLKKDRQRIFIDADPIILADSVV